MATSNPLQNILTPDQFQKCINFYEADQKLNHKDRVDLAVQLQSIALKSNLIGYTTGMFGFFGPSLYYRIRKIPPPNPFFLIQSPFLSLCIGFGALIISNNLSTKYYYNKYKNHKNDFPNKNVYDVWQAMDYQNLGMFTLYYTRTSLNPMFIIRDPRTCSNEAEIDQTQPQHYVGAVGLGKQDNKGGKHDLGVWDKVKLHHGFDVSTPQK
ncbi:hypothetical protein KGF54_001057 [Candida jiufengensis]|uniref:uncharacterized protein n=1 Tax=Candida jiufengensis TaxID=497108 RepID=UPI002225968A|nr:uncharacterized protein KGF54_001057 [Candida jiufengensis]KAI5956582.1 hypothetical protein KGF54_001057 [Candida jiufengensis]